MAFLRVGVAVLLVASAIAGCVDLDVPSVPPLALPKTLDLSVRVEGLDAEAMGLGNASVSVTVKNPDGSVLFHDEMSASSDIMREHRIVFETRGPYRFNISFSHPQQGTQWLSGSWDFAILCRTETAIQLEAVYSHGTFRLRGSGSAEGLCF